ncbi:hypothetical protein EVAR_27770_1 [Eumeta japonica]|uniref:Uncharacterized protein n=1 Tax=Eumeta variegata TaxID=151549 RepID=A0A4C1VB69_EUMVA|nr:hypothetical protein EVAR_27770_1 [Eumeta japonica]
MGRSWTLPLFEAPGRNTTSRANEIAFYTVLFTPYGCKKKKFFNRKLSRVVEEAVERTLLIAEALFECRCKRNLFIKSGAGGEGRELPVARHGKSHTEPVIPVKNSITRDLYDGRGHRKNSGKSTNTNPLKSRTYLLPSATSGAQAAREAPGRRNLATATDFRRGIIPERVATHPISPAANRGPPPIECSLRRPSAPDAGVPIGHFNLERERERKECERARRGRRAARGNR